MAKCLTGVTVAESPPCGRRTGFGGPTPPERTPPPPPPAPILRADQREYSRLVAELPDCGGHVLALSLGQLGIAIFRYWRARSRKGTSMPATSSASGEGGSTARSRPRRPRAGSWAPSRRRA